MMNVAGCPSLVHCLGCACVRVCVFVCLASWCFLNPPRFWPDSLVHCPASGAVCVGGRHLCVCVRAPGITAFVEYNLWGGCDALAVQFICRCGRDRSAICQLVPCQSCCRRRDSMDRTHAKFAPIAQNMTHFCGSAIPTCRARGVLRILELWSLPLLPFWLRPGQSVCITGFFQVMQHKGLTSDVPPASI